MMKKLLSTLVIILTTLSMNGQNFAPSLIFNTEFLLQGMLVDHEGITTIDPTVTPPDTMSILTFTKSASDDYLAGREVLTDINDTAEWSCSVSGQVNSVAILQAGTANDTAQLEELYGDAMGRDTLIISYADTGTGVLARAQEIYIEYGTTGIDSVVIYIYQNQNRVPLLAYGVDRNQGRVDTVRGNIFFSGLNVPIQRLDYHYTANRLDSIDLVDPSTGNVEEQIRPTLNANDKITAITFYERDPSNEWSPYNIYVFDPTGSVGLAENTKKQIAIYPNPVNEVLNVEVSKNSTVQILCPEGKLIRELSLKPSQNTIDCQELKKGIYFLKVADGQRNSVVRFIKR